MQDLKNNDANKNLGDHGGDNRPNSFDQELRRLLADAEVSPDDALMDKMFARLQMGERAVEKDHDKSRPAQVKPPVKLARGLRLSFKSKLSYAAAVGAILIMLTIGIKELGKKDTVILPPEGLTVLNQPTTPRVTDQNGQTDAKVNTNQGAKTDMVTASATLTAKSNEGLEEPKKALKKEVQRDVQKDVQRDVQKESQQDIAALKKPRNNTGTDNGVVTAGRSIKNTTDLASGATKDKAVIARANGKGKGVNQINNATGQVENKSLTDAVASGLTKMDGHNGATQTAGLALQRQKKTTMDANESAIAHTDQQAQTIVTSSLDVDQLTAKDYNQTVLADHKTHVRRNRKKGGFFRGLVQKISNGAKSISEDVVTQDEDKTVINIGIVAITAYK
ncbi:hypothetical protein GCM10027566_31850 [Arachidicoccus ginsenosidivorans]|uniref:Uncharacterized protein n=1 Tax=Arachidicoccus ginsenosidivorans TaxID=496057 RepID=A0A5B8VJC2_9BACT|nr:hypothetical protein [Arachidicoccus ginsenosidivorans]QEC71409.1 hypothetical protein FSB73_06720 [Arachidicoccus ginsenosidivorans]